MTAHGSLRENLLQALDDPAARAAIAIALNVSGGSPAEGYLLNLNIQGDGQMTVEYFDKLIAAEEYRGETELPAETVAQLLAQILADDLLALPEEDPRFAPGSTVGRLTISDGTSTFQRLFAADPDQAEAEEIVPPETLAAFVDRLYRIGAEGIDGVDSITP